MTEVVTNIKISQNSSVSCYFLRENRGPIVFTYCLTAASVSPFPRGIWNAL